MLGGQEKECAGYLARLLHQASSLPRKTCQQRHKAAATLTCSSSIPLLPACHAPHSQYKLAHSKTHHVAELRNEHIYQLDPALLSRHMHRGSAFQATHAGRALQPLQQPYRLYAIPSGGAVQRRAAVSIHHCNRRTRQTTAWMARVGPALHCISGILALQQLIQGTT